MVFFILVAQTLLLKFAYMWLDETTYSGKFEKWALYVLGFLNLLVILRFIYVETNYSYGWFEQIVEIVAFLIALAVVLFTLFFYLIKSWIAKFKNKRKHKI